MIEITPTNATLIADYADGSGRYRIYRDGDYLTTRIGDSDGSDGDAFVQFLTRQPEYDKALDSDLMITETFGANSDFFEDGGVWINGEAFSLEWADDVYLCISTEPSLVDSVRLVVADRRESYPEMSIAEACDHARAVISENDLGSEPLDDAYRAVLSALPSDLIAAEAVVTESE